MSQVIEVKLPGIGDAAAMSVIEVLVRVGDLVAVDDAICVLESDKATMDVPSSATGVVKEVLVKIGDKVAEGAVLLTLESNDVAARSVLLLRQCRLPARRRYGLHPRRRPFTGAVLIGSATCLSWVAALAATPPPFARRIWGRKP